MEFVLHQAAIPSVPRSVKDPVTSNRANIDGSLNVLVAARDAGVKRLVYAGSSSAYGDTADAAEARRHADEAAVAVRAAEARRGTVLPDVHAVVRVRNRHDSLLQRVRTAPGSRVAVLRSDLVVRDGASCRPSAAHLRRRRADARFHLRQQRCRRGLARLRRAEGASAK